MSNGKALFFDGIAYSADDMVSYLRHITSDGVMMESDNSLKPILFDESTIRVLSGAAYLRGYGYVLGNECCDFIIEAGTRTDLIVLQLDEVNKTLELVLKQNQQEPLENELGIAEITVDGENLTITDIRQAATFKLQTAANDLKVSVSKGSNVLLTKTEVDILTIPLPNGYFYCHEIILYTSSSYPNLRLTYVPSENMFLSESSTVGEYSYFTEGAEFSIASSISVASGRINMRAVYENGSIIIKGYQTVNDGFYFQLTGKALSLR